MLTAEVETIKIRSIGQPGVKDLLISRQNATTTAAKLLLNSADIKSLDNEEIIRRLVKLADGIVAYHWRGIEKP